LTKKGDGAAWKSAGKTVLRKRMLEASAKKAAKDRQVEEK
jgi:hypothetical protein